MAQLMLKKEFWPLVKSGKKRITIRRFLRVREGDEVFVHAGGKIVGKVRIRKVYRKKLGEIGEEEAEKEGMALKELRRLLEMTYGKNPDTELTIAEFEVVETYEPPLDPEEMNYRGENPMELARKILESGIVENDGERAILERLVALGSLRKLAMEMGGLHRRKIIRRVLRKYARALTSSS